MKVKVFYQSINCKEIEVDDKFSSAIPAWENGDDEVYSKLVEELHSILRDDIPGDICGVFDEQDDVIYEI